MKPEERNKQTPINEYFIDPACPKTRSLKPVAIGDPDHPRPASHPKWATASTANPLITAYRSSSSSIVLRELKDKGSPLRHLWVFTVQEEGYARRHVLRPCHRPRLRHRPGCDHRLRRAGRTVARIRYPARKGKVPSRSWTARYSDTAWSIS